MKGYPVCFVLTYSEQKQFARDVLIKMCSENMQQIYWRTPTSKCDFNTAAYFQNIFS